MIEITDIRADDLPQLAGLFEELVGEKTDLGKMAESFRWMKGNADYIVLGAKRQGRLAGSLMGVVGHDLVGECRPFMVVENVIVAGGYRGQGIGRRLMQTIEDIARERGCGYVMFVSAAQRKEAHRFYESLGYRRDAVQGFKKRLP